MDGNCKMVGGKCCQKVRLNYVLVGYMALEILYWSLQGFVRYTTHTYVLLMYLSIAVCSDTE